jgi:acyl carrier protein
VINLYGQTESVVDVSYLDTTGQHYTDGQIIPIGRSIPGSSIYITNELGMLQPIGVPGEICIGGDAIASGYFNNLELTSEKFKMDFYNNSSSAKMFCTGDFAKRKECGELEFIGRKDDQVRVRGYRVELSEVESAIMEYEGISKAVAAVKEWPDHEIKLVGYFEQEGHELDIFDLRRFLALRLPDYQVPSLLVSLDNFPLTPTGKVDRKALPIPSSDEFDRQFLAPRTYTEKRLCEIWQELLSVERVGAMDDFFAVGGHSLLASKLAVRVQTAFGVELPIKDIFDKPVLSEQAEFVAKVVYQKELKVIREEKKVLESGVL